MIQRSKRLPGCRVTAAERAAFEEKVLRSGLSHSEFLRQLVSAVIITPASLTFDEKSERRDIASRAEVTAFAQ